MLNALLKTSALAAALLTCAAVVGLAAGQLRDRPAPVAPVLLPAGSPAPAPADTSIAGPLTSGQAPVVAAPDPPGPRLKIPRLGVNAPIEAVGLDSQHRIAMASSGGRVGWFRDSPFPGRPGSAILDGHLTYSSGPAVFADLGRLRAGDLLSLVDGAGQTLAFRVDTLERYAPTASPTGLFASSGPARLALITCAGTWNEATATYSDRLVIRASLEKAS
ncbi:MAG: class F sortase [Chloroflexota bacterium]